jgi:hypothetical protein
MMTCGIEPAIPAAVPIIVTATFWR